MPKNVNQSIFEIVLIYLRTISSILHAVPNRRVLDAYSIGDPATDVAPAY